MAITTLLLDADGVVQHNWELLDRLHEMIGDQASWDDLMAAEQAAITGTVDVHESLGRFVADNKLSHTADEFLTTWNTTVTDPEAIDLVRRVRQAGTRVYLATNQQPLRGQWMLDTLGYDQHFDGLFFSFQMGEGKPQPAYFEHIVDKLGVRPDEVLFIDDMPANVEGARAAGLSAEWHDPHTPASDLERILREHGVRF